MIQRKALLCPELEAVLELEIARGNSIVREPALYNWPAPDSVVAHLFASIRTPKDELPSNVTTSICNDPHYGWYNEAFCTVHKHLLTAGGLRPGKPMWVKA